MVKFMNWAQGIFTFNPAASSYVADASIVFKMHIFLGLTIFILFPFTRLVHMLSAPVRCIWRPGYQVVRERNHTAAPSASARSCGVRFMVTLFDRKNAEWTTGGG